MHIRKLGKEGKSFGESNKLGKQIELHYQYSKCYGHFEILLIKEAHMGIAIKHE